MIVAPSASSDNTVSLREKLDATRTFVERRELQNAVDAAALAAQAQRNEASAISMIAPSYFKPRNLEDLVACCAQVAAAARAHWRIENSLHWVLDVVFREDQSRLRKGHGAKNMAIVRHFALNLVRQAKDKRSIKRRRKLASWNPQYLLDILGPLRR